MKRGRLLRPLFFYTIINERDQLSLKIKAITALQERFRQLVSVIYTAPNNTHENYLAQFPMNHLFTISF
jgi:hypothetical protein